MQLNGIHHVTAVSARIADNVEFYTQVLGLRLVKKSVNQDDVSAYHLFYADKAGSPGTDMTFFDWPHVGPNVRGADSIAGTAFRVSSREALDFWVERFDEFEWLTARSSILPGANCCLLKTLKASNCIWSTIGARNLRAKFGSDPDIPDEYALRGFYSVIFHPFHRSTGMIFTDILNFEEVERAHGSTGNRTQSSILRPSAADLVPKSGCWNSQPGPRTLGRRRYASCRLPGQGLRNGEKWHAHLNGSRPIRQPT